MYGESRYIIIYVTIVKAPDLKISEKNLEDMVIVFISHLQLSVDVDESASGISLC